MGLITVIFDPSKCIPYSESSHFFDGIELKPGENLLSETFVANLRKHPDYAQYKSWGAIAIQPN